MSMYDKRYAFRVGLGSGVCLVGWFGGFCCCFGVGGFVCLFVLPHFAFKETESGWDKQTLTPYND